MKPNIYPGMSRAEYAKIDAINISRLCEGATMMHLKYLLDHLKYQSSDALDIGIAAHLAVFEPSAFEKKVLKIPDCDRRTKAGKEAYEAFKALAAGDEVLLKHDHYETVVGMRDALRRNECVREMLESKGSGEMAVVWRDTETGVFCKGIVDRYCDYHGWPMIPDLKTCADASPRAFAKTILNFKYHIKAAWYLDGLSAIAPCDRRFCWIACEKDAPYAVAVYEPDSETLGEGRRIYRRLLNEFAESKKTNTWQGYPEGIQPITLPKFGFGD